MHHNSFIVATKVLHKKISDKIVQVLYIKLRWDRREIIRARTGMLEVGREKILSYNTISNFLTEVSVRYSSFISLN